ncbi:hypothetical protein C1646_774955 [Rhizophagus diaphanus]|nr:hypothetical protein C1646_774955 [Rhizophagus diaphanus] [Rhizophagus sp. MUCL 43196]
MYPPIMLLSLAIPVGNPDTLVITAGNAELAERNKFVFKLEGASSENKGAKPEKTLILKSLAKIKEIQPEGSAEPFNEKGKGTAANTNNPVITNATATRLKKKVITQKKHQQKIQPSISAHIQPYNIIADLQQQRANISFRQLFQISSKLRSNVGKSLRKPGTQSSKMVAQFSN